MYFPEFVIPLNREDLMQSSNPGQFIINEEYSVEEIRERLESARTELNEEGTDFISNHFSTYFSLLQKFKVSPQLAKEKGWKTIRKAFNLLCRNLEVLFEDSSNLDFDVQNKMCNVTKMITYIVIEMMKMYQDQYIQLNTNTLDGKSKKKPNKCANDDWDWNEEKHKVLIEIHSFIQFPLKLLWEPPVVDEDFINLIANFCYNCLEDPFIGNASTKYLRETIFQILGILIKNYLHGLSFCVKMVQLLRTNDHLVNTLAQGIVHLVKECKCVNIVKEIVREVAETDGDQLAADTAGTRSLNLFLVQLAECIPESILPAIDLLTSHLNGDSYSMRICVVGVLGEIVLTVLTKENLDENMKRMRDEYLDCLEEHIHDVNAFVRTKVLQIWQKLCAGKGIPILRVNRLLNLVIGRLNDKSSNVKKQAVHLIKDLLEGNPFCGQLNISEIESQLKQERKKLDALEFEYNLSDPEVDWKEMLPQVNENLENIVEENIIMDSENVIIEEVIDTVGTHLIHKEYKKAIDLILKLKNEFYNVYNIKKEDCSSEILADILKKVFKQKKKALLLNVPIEVQEKIEKHQKAIEYLESALEFSELIDRAVPVILTFLDSNIISDVLEAINFFTAAYLFGFNQALEGVRKMLYLVFSKESNVKSAVSTAYKDLYFHGNGSGRQQCISIVKNLSQLVLKLNYSHLDALEEVVKEWVKAGVIEKDCVQVLFERFSMKLPGTSRDQCWAALVLIRMVGSEEPKIIKSNLSVLLNEGLRNHGSKCFLIAKETCKALQHLLPPKEQGKAFDHTLRYPRDHELFGVLYNLMKIGIWKVDDPYYIPMADEAINLIFRICNQPDDFCKQLIMEIHEHITTGNRPIERKALADGNILKNKNNDDFFFGEPEIKELENSLDKKSPKKEKENEDIEDPNALFISLLTRFISLLGQVASNYILFLEGPVLDELKLRNQSEYEKKLKKLEDKKNVNISIRRKRKGINDTGNLNDTAAEDLEFNRVAADDIDAEEMRKKTENRIVTGDGLFAKYAPIILAICKNPGKYNNKPLQNAALLTLAKFMQVSSVFCEENLQLLMTICEKSQISERQENAIIALGALQYRFPNSLEPWTPHMYSMLQCQNPSVRYSSILVLTDLIVNEMIKVRSHISNLAICIVDKEIKIARVARHFFREYSQKGNSLYNVLPTLISNLTQPNAPLSQEEFKIVMKYVLSLVTKEKQSEYLVEKLLQYFESASSERQWCDLAYCLSLLNYSDKGLKKILENTRCFANKLYLAEVYEAFNTIVSDASKNPQKDKMLINELTSVINDYRGKSCVGKPVCPPSTKKKTVRRKYVPSDSEEEELERKVRNNHRKRKIVFDKQENSDEDNDEEGVLSDTSEKKVFVNKAGNANKENDVSRDSDDLFQKETRTRSKTLITKSSKQVVKIKNDSSEDDDEKEVTNKRLLRSCRKRK